MALSSALATARNSLKTTSGQLNVVSQNIAGARDPNYVRRTTATQSGPHGSVYATIRRDGNQQLLNNYTIKSSQAAASNTVAAGADRLSSIYSSGDFSNSPARLLSQFRDALQTWYNQYDQSGAGEAAVARAKDLAEGLNYGAKEIERLRNDADNDIKASVDHINDLLAQFHEVDQQIFGATAAGRDSFAYMDQRDAILKELSQETGITSVTHPDGTMTLYGMGGSTLYDKMPRKVTFEPSAALPAGATGNAVFVDGVPLSHSSFNDPNGGGNLGGLLKVRDDVTPQYQKQLDEMADALQEMFAGPPALFLDGGDSSATGLSGRLTLNPAFDPGNGGSPEAFGSRDQLLALVDKFDESRNYGAGTGISGNPSILKFAENSTAWLEGVRKDSASTAEYQNTMFMRAGEALSNETGVNTDDEMALMLQLEQTYSATARIISTVGKMLDDLMAAIR